MTSEYFDPLLHAQPDIRQPIVEVYYRRPDDVMTHIHLRQNRISAPLAHQRCEEKMNERAGGMFFLMDRFQADFQLRGS